MGSPVAGGPSASGSPTPRGRRPDKHRDRQLPGSGGITRRHHAHHRRQDRLADHEGHRPQPAPAALARPSWTRTVNATQSPASRPRLRSPVSRSSEAPSLARGRQRHHGRTRARRQRPMTHRPCVSRVPSSGETVSEGPFLSRGGCRKHTGYAYCVAMSVTARAAGPAGAGHPVRLPAAHRVRARHRRHLAAEHRAGLHDAVPARTRRAGAGAAGVRRGAAAVRDHRRRPGRAHAVVRHPGRARPTGRATSWPSSWRWR